MGHTAGKDIYRNLGRKIDNLTVRAPWNDRLYAILKELYSEEEADLVVRMPYGLSTLDRLEEVTKIGRAKLQNLLDGLCAKGLVMDLFYFGGYRYMPSPMIIGIFEFTMMRTDGGADAKRWAKLFNDYMMADDAFFSANFGADKRVSPLRTLPYEDAVGAEEYVEVLDYEKARAIVDRAKRFSVSICSCRHEKHHLGEKKCDTPLETCTSMGGAAEYLIRNNLGREISKEEMHAILDRSQETGLVLNADNVRRNVSFICHCCSCCCNVLLGITKFGYANTIVTSSFIAHIESDACTECGECIDECPVGALSVHPFGYSQVDEKICLGCGVCVLSCEHGAMSLRKRKRRVLHPENTIERVLLQSLERGTLQNLIFDNPNSASQGFMRGLLGAFLRLPPMKRALMSESLRSRFLDTVRKKRK